jgi:homoserine O-succinyltransferase
MDMHPAAAQISVLLVCFTQGETRRYTEQQFRAIFAAPIRDGTLQLTCITLQPAEAAVTTAILEAAGPDALIVTGMQPRTVALAEDPLWPALTALVDFATTRAVPTVWSCLAAHAAVLHLDGIDRRRLPQKLAGLIACDLTDATHPFMAGLPKHWNVPHSRYNDISQNKLVSRGYRVLSTVEQDGADIFASDTHPQFLFCQGHPEYDAHALLREYRRDIRQFLAGEADDYPATPQSYFSPGVLSLLDSFRHHAQSQRTPRALAAFPVDACEADVTHSWRDLGTGLFANWLTPLHASRSAHTAVQGW